MFAQSTPTSDERAVETGQLSQPAQPHLPKADTVGYFEPHQMTKLAENGRLYVIADSVGVAASGQMAAQYTVKRILRTFYTTDTPDLEARLLEVIQQANKEIIEFNQQHPSRRPLAAYVTAALIHNNKLLVANVGDNRVYVVWDKDIEQLNATTAKADEDKPEKDKAPPVRLIPEKASTPSDKPAKPLDLPPPKSQTPPPLGLTEEPNIETFSRRLFSGDTVVLCSGGLTGYVSDKEIAETITLHAPNQAIQQLMLLAGERGNRGHIAMSVTRVLSSPVAAQSPMPMVMPTPPKWSDWQIPSKPPTRPLSKPIPATSPTGSLGGAKPLATPKRKSKPVEIPLSQPRRLPWRGCALAAAILIVLCAVPILAWRFLLPDDVLASVPFLSGIGETLRARAEVLGIELPASEANELDATAPEAPSLVAGQIATPTPLNAPQTTTAIESNSPLPTPTAAAPAATTPTAAATPTAESIPTFTPSPTPPPTVELPANCESKARFVTDVSVEDGTEFPPGQSFDKVWRLRNEGTCPWGPGFSVRFLNGDFFGVQQEVPVVEVTTPDETSDISVAMVAPTEPGDYRGVWQLYDLEGEPFGPTMYLEIEVVPGAVAEVETTGSDTIYDFIANAGNNATWSSGPVSYTPQQTLVSEELTLPDGGGLVAVGVAQLRGNTQSEAPALLTYPNQELGFIKGDYVVDTPLQPGDALVATLGFTKLSILSDDGVTFEVIFTPDDGSRVISILSQNVQYADSPVTQTVPLTGIQPGQTGTFTLRVLSGDSTSRDWALWIDLRLVRP